MKVQKSWSIFCAAVCLCIAVIATVFFALTQPLYAAPGINNQIHFQGKVVNNANGTNVADGSYNFIFKIYTVSSAGTELWTETKSLTVTNGIFQTYLGDTTSLPSIVDFNSDELYVGVDFNGDGEMTPRIRLSAVPYAFNATKVAGLTVTDTTGTLTIGNGKTVEFADDFTTVGANPITLTTTGATSIVLPLTGTLGTLLGTETLTNKTIGSTGLVFSGATTDITSGTNEDIVINAHGIGSIIFNDTTTLAAGKSLIITGDAGNPLLFDGTVWYDNSAHKFKVVENSAAKTLCNTTDLGCSSATSVFSGLTAATATNSIDNSNYAQEWNWNTATSETAISLGSSSLTSGGLLAVNSSAAANFTGSLVSLGLTEATGASSNTGSILTLTNSGTSNNGAALAIQNNATGGDSLSLRVNDQDSDTTPTVIDSYGRLGLGTASPQSLLQVGSGSNNGDISLYGELTKEGYARTHGLTNIVDVFVYDTDKDNDSGDWVWRSANFAWATETKDDGLGDPCVVATDDRCGRNMFPEKAIIVTTTSGLYIFDSRDNGLWMKFTQDGTYALGADANNNPSGVTALNGVIYVGANGSSGTGLYALDFVNDQMYRYNTSGRLQAVQSIAERNTAVSYSLNSKPTLAIVDSIVNDVDITITDKSISSNAINGITLIGVATDTGVSIIHPSRGQVFSYSDVTGDDYNAVFVSKRGRFFAVNETLAQAERWDNVDIDQASELNGAPNKFWDETSIPPLAKSTPTIPASPDILEVVELGSYATNTDDILYVGHSQGLTEIHNATNGWSRFIDTARQTDLMPVTIRGMFGFDDASGDATDYSFRNNVLQPHGTISYREPGVRGTAVTFNGATPTKFCSDTNNDGTCDVDTDFNPGTQPFSISFWMKRNGIPSVAEVLVDKLTTAAGAIDTGGFRITVSTSGTLRFDIDDDSTVWDDTAIGTEVYTDGIWHHVTALKTTSAIQLYVDGNLIAEDTSLTATGALGTAGVLSVGGSCQTTGCTAGNFFFNGSMDELRMSMGGAGTVDLLTSDHVNNIYNVGRGALIKREISVTDATTVSTTTIGDSGETWIPGEFVGQFVELTGGTGSGQTRQVINNTATTLTVTPAWAVTPDTTTDFAIEPETLYGSSNNVTSINIEKPVNFGQGYKVYVGTNDGADGGGVTVFSSQAFIKSDVYHSDAGKVDDYGNAWTGSGSDNIQGISSAGSTFAFGSAGRQWAETDAFTLQGLEDRYVQYAQNFRAQTIADGLTGIGLEIGMLGGADLAEYYDSAEQLQAGDIVALTGEGAPQNVQKTTHEYDLRAIGVIATQPGMILGTQSGNSYPVALVGRVPVKVTTENGVIKAGDQVTSSSVAGYGMFADQAGVVIGKALEDFNDENSLPCPETVTDPTVQCGQVMVFVNLSQSLGMPIEAMIDKSPRLVLRGIDHDFSDSVLITADPDQQSILSKLTATFRNRVLNASSSSASTQTLRIDRLQANRDIIAPNIIADRIFARSIRADRIEGLEVYTNRLDSISEDLIAQMNQLKAAQSATVSASSSATVSTPGTVASAPILSEAGILGTVLNAAQLELQGLVVQGAATIKNITFFDRVVEFASKVIFSDDIDVEGLTYLAEDSIGEAILEPNTLETKVTFKQPYDFPPIVSVTLNIDWSGLDVPTQKRLQKTLADGKLQYYVIDRTAEHFTISVRETLDVPLKFTWTAWPVKEDFMPMVSSPAPVFVNVSPSPVPMASPLPGMIQL